MHPPRKINTVIVGMSRALSMSTGVTSLSRQQSTSALSMSAYLNVRACQCPSHCHVPLPISVPLPVNVPLPVDVLFPVSVSLPVNVPFPVNARSLSMSYQFAAPVNVTPSVNVSMSLSWHCPSLSIPREPKHFAPLPRSKRFAEVRPYIRAFFRS